MNHVINVFARGFFTDNADKKLAIHYLKSTSLSQETVIEDLPTKDYKSEKKELKT